MENSMSYDCLANSFHLFLLFKETTCGKLTLVTNIKVKRISSDYISSKIILVPNILYDIMSRENSSIFPFRE